MILDDWWIKCGFVMIPLPSLIPSDNLGVLPLHDLDHHKLHSAIATKRWSARIDSALNPAGKKKLLSSPCLPPLETRTNNHHVKISGTKIHKYKPPGNQSRCSAGQRHRQFSSGKLEVRTEKNATKQIHKLSDLLQHLSTDLIRLYAA